MLLKNRHGFTLLELLIVLSIIGILSSIALPNFLSWRPKLQLGNAARDIYSNSQKAKIEAVKRRSYCTVTFNVDGYEIYEDSNKNFVRDAGENLIASVSLSDYGNVRFDTTKGGGDGLELSNPADSIAFSASGFPRKAGGLLGSGTIYLTHRNDAGKTMEVNIASSGSIHLE